MTHHSFQMVEDTVDRHTFYKSELFVETAVSNIGFLVIAAKGKKMAFAYEFDEVLFRICPL
jgi:hypothetical protein